MDFVYHPDNCGEVLLKIIFPSFMVSKTWPDRFGFPLFLRQFVNGSYVFRPDDFDPQYQVALKRKKITWIRITYDIERKAAAEVMELLNTMPEDVPACIIEGASSHVQ
jgi:hypothetical protein